MMDARTSRILEYEARACGVTVQDLIDAALRDFTSDRLQAALARTRFGLPSSADIDGRTFSKASQNALTAVFCGDLRTTPALANSPRTKRHRQVPAAHGDRQSRPEYVVDRIGVRT